MFHIKDIQYAQSVDYNADQLPWGVQSMMGIDPSLSETNYIPPLTALDYIDRISRQVSLPDSIRDRALSLVQHLV